jgi:pimeloyl-ACP methyl ester carboxylesterase/DNA-binding CsgD family transcriptional regulator
MSQASQTIRFTTAPDGVRLAWAASGQGPTVVKAATWLTHLEYDWENPVWSHWTEFFSEHFCLIRYDERGSGLSDQNLDDFPITCWKEDLATVVDASAAEEPFVLLGISGGATPAVEYAVEHPERVSHLIIYGGYSSGWKAREDSESARRWQAIIELTELGWGRPEPVFRRLYTSLFLPEGTDEQLSWFDELCRRTTSPRTAALLMQCRGNVDIEHLLPRITVPTMIIHAVNDAVVPFDQGRNMASQIPGAEMVPVDSKNHILMSSEPGWDQFKSAVLGFTGRQSAEEAAIFADLSARERDILAGIAAGQTNAEIGAALFISDKTVRNHITNLFGKLGVKTRAQAIVLARDQGFRGA